MNEWTNQSVDINIKFMVSRLVRYEGGLKSSRPSLRETRDKRPLDKESNNSWCHRHTTSMIKLFWSQPMAPWVSAAA